MLFPVLFVGDVNIYTPLGVLQQDSGYNAGSWGFGWTLDF